MTLEEIKPCCFGLRSKRLSVYVDKRLIEKQIAFVIPGKQLFIPQLMVNLKEFRYDDNQNRREIIPPAAQCLLLYHILKEKLEQLNFKQIAAKLNYTPMTITRAANQLKEINLCLMDGAKDKRLTFAGDRKILWEKALPYLQNPVKRKIYIEENIDNNLIYRAGYSALSFYTNISWGINRILCYFESQLPVLKKTKADQNYK